MSRRPCIQGWKLIVGIVLRSGSILRIQNNSVRWIGSRGVREPQETKVDFSDFEKVEGEWGFELDVCSWHDIIASHSIV